MKYLFFVFLLVSFSASAQFSKGTISLGGNFSFTSISENDNDTFYPASKYLSVNPMVGIFLTPSFSLGVFTQISSQKNPRINVTTNFFETQKSVFQIYGLYARKYFTLSDKFLLSLIGSGGIGSRVINEDSEDKTNQFSISIAPKLSFIPHKNWGIEAGFGVVSYQKNSQQNTYYNSDQFSANLGSLSLGVNYFINRKD